MNRWKRLRWGITWGFQIAGLACILSSLSTLLVVTVTNSWVGGMFACMPLVGIIMWVKTAFLYILGSGEAPYWGLRPNQEFLQWFAATLVLFYPMLVCLSLSGVAAGQFGCSTKAATLANAVAILLVLGIPLLSRPSAAKGSTQMHIMFPKSASVASQSGRKEPLEIQPPEKLAYALALGIGLFQLAVFAKPPPLKLAKAAPPKTVPAPPPPVAPPVPSSLQS